MWFPDINLDKWLKINPDLKKGLPIRCLCSRKAHNLRPYVTENWVGVVSSHCKCGLGATSISIPRTSVFENNMKNIVDKIL